jgi:dipeptidyl aminopeptidase/acylaminoacyl peptidase
LTSAVPGPGSGDKLNVKKGLRLAAFAFLTSIALYLAVNLSLAWGYVGALTHPGCIANPLPILGLPAPVEAALTIEAESKIRAWYYPPKNGAAILALGGPGGALGNSLPPVEFLIRQGYGVLQIDSRACAEPPTRVTLGAREVEEAAAGLDFLLSQEEVEYIGAFGFSMGGVTAIRAAARHPEIEAVAAEGGYFNLGADFIEPEIHSPLPLKVLLYTVAGSFWLQSGQNPWEVSPIDDLPNVSPRPVLLIYGQNELDDSHAQAHYAAARQPKTLWVVPGGSHGKNYQKAPEEYRQRVLEFFDHNLRDRADLRR